MDESKLYSPNIIPFSSKSKIVILFSLLSLPVKTISAFVPASASRLVEVYISPKECLATVIGFFQPGIIGVIVSNVIGFLKTVPSRAFLIVALVLLVLGTVPSSVIFIVGTIISLVINYPNIKDQKERIEKNAPDALNVSMVVISAGIFMGILSGTGMSDAIAQSMSSVIPESMGKFWGLFTAAVSIPGTVFLSNDAFYYGVLPVLAESGYQYGFTPLQLGFASLYGQAFHLLSPLVPFIYVLLRMTDVDMGQWQKKSAVYAIGIFVIYIIVGTIFGLVPIGI